MMVEDLDLKREIKRTEKKNSPETVSDSLWWRFRKAE